MRGKPDPSSYAQKNIALYLEGLSRERVAVLRSGDIEGVHRMRVATRRLRAILDVFSVVLPALQADAWETKIAKIGKLLGRARECDVQIRFLKTLPPDQNRDRLIKRLKKERNNEQKKIVRRLTGLGDIKKKLPGLAAWLHELLPEEDIRCAMAFRSHAKKILRARTAKLLALAPYARMPERIKELHRLRIAAKKLRYTLELLRPWYGPGINKYIHASRALQDVLGDLHELDVLIAAMRGLSQKSELVLTCVTRRRDVYKRFVRIWEHAENNNVWGMLRRTF
jgi:CHAD domain-containing protein